MHVACGEALLSPLQPQAPPCRTSINLAGPTPRCRASTARLAPMPCRYTSIGVAGPHVAPRQVDQPGRDHSVLLHLDELGRDHAVPLHLGRVAA
jgi:hypothetical protein